MFHTTSNFGPQFRNRHTVSEASYDFQNYGGNMNEKIKSALGNLLGILLVLVAGYGWILNIITVVKTVHDPATGMYILRIFGIFIFPLGIALGLFFS